VPTTPARRRSGRVPLTLGALGALLLAGTALAGPAAALEDPRRPVAEVTHGPSCGPGVVRLQVTNGNQPTRVALVFDGTVGQDAAELDPAEQVELASSDVAWGTTVHVTVTVAGATGAAQLPLDLGTYTRPSKADCDALVPGPEPSGASTGITSALPGTTVPAGAIEDPALPPVGIGGTAPLPDGTPSPQVAPVGDQGPAGAADVPLAPVAHPGGVVTVRGSGFTSGEPVDVTLDGVDEPLATVLAAGDGTIEAVVQIPRGASLGAVTVQLVGRSSSATSGLDLQVAARQQTVSGGAPPVPVIAAGSALLLASAGLGMATARRPWTLHAHAVPRVAAWRH
jgi:hypothetical protein